VLHVAHYADNPIVANLGKRYGPTDGVFTRKISSRQFAVNDGDQWGVDGVLSTDEPPSDERYSHNLQKIRAGYKSQSARCLGYGRGTVGFNPEGNGVVLMSHRHFRSNF